MGGHFDPAGTLQLVRGDRVSQATSPCARRDRRFGKATAVLLGCGVASSVLYAAADVLAGQRYDGYSFKSQAVSELSAAGAPTRPLVVGLFTPYNALVMALGIGVWTASLRTRAGLLAGVLLISSAVVGEVTTLFFPMDQRGAEETLRGSMHPPLTAVMSLFIVAAMISAAASQGRRFRRYSIATILTLAVFGGLAARYAPQLEANEPTPWLGVLERINIYAYLLWVAVFAISLLRRQENDADGVSSRFSPALTRAGPIGTPRGLSLEARTDWVAATADGKPANARTRGQPRHRVPVLWRPRLA